MYRTSVILFLAATSLACSGPAEEGEAMMSVEIPFEAIVGDQAFSCDATFEGLGRGNSTFTPKDFRLYVHDVRLVNGDGQEVSVKLEDDGTWQTGTVALLDFEDKTGTCANGTTQVNRVIRGEVPEGTYLGLKLVLGVPFDVNHGNQALAASPLNISGLWWSWQAGYKFFKLDGGSDTEENLLFHLGSTGCEMGAGMEVTSCAQPNRSDISLDAFAPGGTVTLDVAALFDGAHLDTDEGGPKGCMSGPSDPDCAPLFSNLGIPRDGNTSTQKVFGVK